MMMQWLQSSAQSTTDMVNRRSRSDDDPPSSKVKHPLNTKSSRESSEDAYMKSIEPQVRKNIADWNRKMAKMDARWQNQVIYPKSRWWKPD